MHGLDLVKVTILANNGGILASKLKHNRGKGLSCSPHDKLAHLRRANKGHLKTYAGRGAGRRYERHDNVTPKGKQTSGEQIYKDD
jgi:hypothetical protein